MKFWDGIKEIIISVEHINRLQAENDALREDRDALKRYMESWAETAAALEERARYLEKELKEMTLRQR